MSVLDENSTPTSCAKIRSLFLLQAEEGRQGLFLCKKEGRLHVVAGAHVSHDASSRNRMNPYLHSPCNFYLKDNRFFSFCQRELMKDSNDYKNLWRRRWLSYIMKIYNKKRIFIAIYYDKRGMNHDDDTTTILHWFGYGHELGGLGSDGRALQGAARQGQGHVGRAFV